LLLSTGVDAPLLLLLLKGVDGVLWVLLLLHRLRLLLLCALLCWDVLRAAGLLLRDAVGWDLLGCRGCLVGCLLPREITQKTGPLPDVEFHLPVEAVLLPVSAGDCFALMFKTGVQARCP
jgi:hypothetical protein